MFYPWQTDLNRRASEITELRNSLSFQETASTKAKEELTLALASMEKLRKDFEAERSTWEVQRDALEKRAKDAEAALNPVTQELTGLKQQIENMTSGIFGEYLSSYICILAIFVQLRFNSPIAYREAHNSPWRRCPEEAQGSLHPGGAALL